MTYNKSTFAKFPTKSAKGEKANHKKNVVKINNKRLDAINKLKPHPPANNGWWYYEMFSRDTFNRRQRQKRR